MANEVQGPIDDNKYEPIPDMVPDKYMQAVAASDEDSVERLNFYIDCCRYGPPSWKWLQAADDLSTAAGYAKTFFDQFELWEHAAAVTQVEDRRAIAQANAAASACAKELAQLCIPQQQKVDAVMAAAVQDVMHNARSESVRNCINGTEEVELRELIEKLYASIQSSSSSSRGSSSGSCDGPCA